MANGLASVAQREAAPGLAIVGAQARRSREASERERGFLERGRERFQVGAALTGTQLETANKRIDQFKTAVDLAKAKRKATNTAAIGVSLIGAALGLSPAIAAALGSGLSTAFSGEPPSAGAAEIGAGLGGVAQRGALMTTQARRRRERTATSERTGGAIRRLDPGTRLPGTAGPGF